MEKLHESHNYENYYTYGAPFQQFVFDQHVADVVDGRIEPGISQPIAHPSARGHIGVGKGGPVDPGPEAAEASEFTQIFD